MNLFEILPKSAEFNYANGELVQDEDYSSPDHTDQSIASDDFMQSIPEALPNDQIVASSIQSLQSFGIQEQSASSNAKRGRRRIKNIPTETELLDALEKLITEVAKLSNSEQIGRTGRKRPDVKNKKILSKIKKF